MDGHRTEVVGTLRTAVAVLAHRKNTLAEAGTASDLIGLVVGRGGIVVSWPLSGVAMNIAVDAARSSHVLGAP